MQRGFIDELTHQWKNGGMHIKLIGVNLIVYVVINLVLSVGQLSVPSGQANPFEDIISAIFTLNGDPKGLITHPWGLITSIFSHFSFFHLAFNMVFLYFMGPIFLHFLYGKRLLYTFILGGIAGGLLQVAAYALLPIFQGGPTAYIVGASGGLNAIFMAIAFYKPNEVVHLFGRFKVKLIVLALIFMLMDFLQMGNGGNVAHFAHIGGALFGILSIQNMQSKNNIISFFERLVANISNAFKRKSHLKVKKGGNNKDVRHQTDEEYNLRKKQKQEEIDIILDKISKSGYESLTTREKQILFDKSQE